MSVETSIAKATAAIDTALAQCSLSQVIALPAMEQTIRMANGMRALRAALTAEVVQELFMPLQGSRLGFRTDKDSKGGYAVGVVTDCLVEAMIRGARPVGNEFNVIGGNAYMTKEFFERQVHDFPGLTDLSLEPGVPSFVGAKAALVPYRATWRLNGQPGELSCCQHKSPTTGVESDTRIPVRVNEGQIVDAVVGKARRKFLSRLYEKLSGISTPDGDVIDTVGEVSDARQRDGVKGAVDALVDRHEAKKGADAAPAEAGK